MKKIDNILVTGSGGVTGKAVKRISKNYKDKHFIQKAEIFMIILHF